MSDRQSGSYGLRRAAPKKINQDYAYFSVKKEEPEAKRAKSNDETHIDIFANAENKKGRGRPRKSDPAVPDLPRPPSVSAETIMIGSNEAETTIEEEVVEHTEEVIPFDASAAEFVLGEDGETIQIIDFPIRIETVEETEDAEKVDDDLNLDNMEEKVECEECHKLLKPSSYRQHLKTHIGDKPYSCEVCDARFTRRGDVERHIRIVHKKDKPYQCHKCTRAFGDKKNLRWHLMNHDKKLFHICETCGFKFGKKDYYDNHVKYIHPLPDQDEDEEAEEECEGGEGTVQYITQHDISEDNDEAVVDSSEELTVVRQPVTLPKRKPAKSAFNNVIDLSHMQLQNILDQSQGRRIAIVGQDSSIKYLTIAPTAHSKSTPQVVNIRTLEKITNLSSQQIIKLHTPSQPKANPDDIKAVVIEVAENEEQPVEEIVVGGDQEEEEGEHSDGTENVTLIKALLDAAKSSESSKNIEYFSLESEESTTLIKNVL